MSWLASAVLCLQLDFYCGFSEIFILSCGIAILKNQAVCGIYKFPGNFSAVCGVLILFCAVFLQNLTLKSFYDCPFTPTFSTECFV